MKHFLLALAITLALTVSLSAYAGEHKKCDKPVQDCLNSMITKLKSSGFIGVEYEPDKKTGTIKVTKVIEGTPAEKAGIQPGDVLYAMNGIKFREKNAEAIAAVKKPGAEVTCTIKRNGENKEIKLTLIPMPADLMAKYIGEHMMSHAESSKPEKTDK